MYSNMLSREIAPMILAASVEEQTAAMLALCSYKLCVTEPRGLHLINSLYDAHIDGQPVLINR